MSKNNEVKALIEDLQTTEGATLSRLGCLTLANLIEELQTENGQMKQYIKNGIRWGYIDDREMEYKKFID